jgi:hypothetical protein
VECIVTRNDEQEVLEPWTPSCATLRSDFATISQLESYLDVYREWLEEMFPMNISASFHEFLWNDSKQPHERVQELQIYAVAALGARERDAFDAAEDLFSRARSIASELAETPSYDVAAGLYFMNLYSISCGEPQRASMYISLAARLMQYLPEEQDSWLAFHLKLFDTLAASDPEQRSLMLRSTMHRSAHRPAAHLVNLFCLETLIHYLYEPDPVVRGHQIINCCDAILAYLAKHRARNSKASRSDWWLYLRQINNELLTAYGYLCLSHKEEAFRWLGKAMQHMLNVGSPGFPLYSLSFFPQILLRFYREAGVPLPALIDLPPLLVAFCRRFPAAKPFVESTQLLERRESTSSSSARSTT